MRARRLARLGLRLRVAAAGATVVAVALVAGATLLVDLLHRRLDDTAKTAATLRAADIAALANSGALPRRLALPGEESSVVQVVDANDMVVSSSANVEGEPPISTRVPSTSASLTFVAVVSALDARDPMRVVATKATTPAGPVVVYAAENLERSEETVRAVVVVLAAAIPLLVILAGGVSWWAVGRALGPVQAISDTMADITTHDLHRRVPVQAAGDEISKLAQTVNDTLQRLDVAVDQQRRFVADASHELRGPLAALRADLEISLAHPQHADWTRTARDSLGDVERLQRLTEDLLALAQLDSAPHMQRSSVDFTEVLSQEAANLRRTDITTEVDIEAGLIIHGNEPQIRRMVRNLVANAERHTSSRVAVRARRSGADVHVIVSDDGPGIPADDRARVFDRFVRLDAARTRDTGGTGLGLAIVRDVVLAHHGTVSIHEMTPSGAAFVVTLPLSKQPGSGR